MTAPQVTSALLLLRPSLFGLFTVLLACDGGGDGDHNDVPDILDEGGVPDGDDPGDGDSPGDGDGDSDGRDPGGDDGVNHLDATDADLAHVQGWFGNSTISHRVELPLTGQGAVLDAQQLVNQLDGYDPGSLLRCAIASDADYQTSIDAIGGVTWGYGVRVLEDLSKPRFMAGLPHPQPPQLAAPGTTDAAGNAGPAVEIVKPDIVAVTEAAALFYSRAHGLMLVDLTGAEPTFACATQLPGAVDQFFFHQGHLVAMTKQQPAAGAESYLVHIVVDGTTLSFVEAISLGRVNILDSRRFNDKLVFYTDLRLEPVQQVAQQPAFPAGPQPGGGVAVAQLPPTTHRSLRVYTLGDTLTKELHDTLIDDALSQDQLISSMVASDTPVGSVVNESRRFGDDMWASDHYFAVTEIVNRTLFDGFRTQNYRVCTESHVVETTYEHCTTMYETRPNPDYVPPSGSGDYACQDTLAECLRRVARSANETIQVPVGKECVDRVRQRWICDRYEQRTTEYPAFSHDQVTRLFIYEYHPQGFVRLDTSVYEITNAGLDALELGDTVPALTTSSESYELSVPGMVQTLRFQGGILYVISEGVLQVYTLDGASLVRTATLQVVNETLQSSLFSEDELFLSDFGWSSGSDMSTLKVVNLSNPAFPRIEGATHSLPGGHSSIIPSRHGIFTIGAVRQFEGAAVNHVKLGLFSDPYAEETAYLILDIGLMDTWLLSDEAHFFSGPDQRLLLPYRGRTTDLQDEYRVSVSRVESTEIVSEGWVALPEPVERVRPAEAEQASFLTFAQNSIHWLRPDGAEWQSSAVLEYFQPFALLRLDEDDNYVEVQRLGARCKVMLANASEINQRANATYSDEFECVGVNVMAYDRTLLFGGSAVEFDDMAELRHLSEAERTTIVTAINTRETCLLSTEPVDNTAIDYASSPEREQFTCLDPTELQMLQQEIAMKAFPAP